MDGASEKAFFYEAIADLGKDMRVDALAVWSGVANLLLEGAGVGDAVAVDDTE